MKRRTHVPRQHNKKIIVLLRTAALKARLIKCFTPEEAQLWLESAQPLLEGCRPVDMLLDDHGYLRVDTVIDQLLEGAYL